MLHAAAQADAGSSSWKVPGEPPDEIRRDDHFQEDRGERIRSRASIERLIETMPPNADTGSEARAA